MPKPDLPCLVQLLDNTIETFRVSVCNEHTRTDISTLLPLLGWDHMLLLSFSVLCWWSSCKCMILSLTPLSYSLPLISISRSTLWPCLKGTLTSSSTRSSSHFGALATSVNHVIHRPTTAESHTLTSVHTRRKAISILLSGTAAVQHLCGNSVRGGRVLGL